MTDRQQDQNRQNQPQQSQGGQQGWDQNQSRQARQDQLGGGQQQGFEAQQSRQPQGGGDSGSFACQLREHQEVVDAQGNHVGTIDHVQGDRIKLARKDQSDGEHHYVALSQVAGVEGDKVRLRERGDNDFGQEAGN